MIDARAFDADATPVASDAVEVAPGSRTFVVETKEPGADTEPRLVDSNSRLIGGIGSDAAACSPGREAPWRTREVKLPVFATTVAITMQLVALSVAKAEGFGSGLIGLIQTTQST